MAATGWQGSEVPGDGSFDIATRGYDRRQVDHHLAELTARLAALDRELQFSRMQTDELTEQLRNAVDRLRQAGGAAQQKDSFGFRVEKILRMAEEEAKEVRARGDAEAAATVERARADTSALVEQARAELVARRAESERVRAEAHRDAEMARAQAHTHAAELTARVEADLADRRRAAERELSRLVTARDQVWTELTRMRDQLRSVLPGRPWTAAAPPAEAGPAGGAGSACRRGDHGGDHDAAHGGADPGADLGAGAAYGGADAGQDTGTGPVVPAQASQSGERPNRHRRHPPATHRVGGEVA